MKTFLENLKNELTRRNFTKKDIEEILHDHEEMIKEAKEEGLSDGDIEEKFGDPATLANDLMDSRNQSFEGSSVDEEAYTLLKSFTAMAPNFDVKVSLVNDDCEYVIHDQETIEVYHKNIKNIDNYHCSFDGKQFTLEEKKKLGLMFGIRLKSGEFLIKVPRDIKSKDVQFKFVSGDAKIDYINTDSFNYKTTSGDVHIRKLETSQMHISTVSGDARIDSGLADTLKMSLISGDIRIKDFSFTGDAYINTVSGDALFREVKAAYVDFKTVSGDCEGHEFYPTSIKLRSVSGDISISNKDTDHKIEVLGKKAVSGSIHING